MLQSHQQNLGRVGATEGAELDLLRSVLGFDGLAEGRDAHVDLALGQRPNRDVGLEHLRAQQGLGLGYNVDGLVNWQLVRLVIESPSRRSMMSALVPAVSTPFSSASSTSSSFFRELARPARPSSRNSGQVRAQGSLRPPWRLTGAGPLPGRRNRRLPNSVGFHS